MLYKQKNWNTAVFEVKYLRFQKIIYFYFNVSEKIFVYLPRTILFRFLFVEVRRVLS